MKQGKGSPNRYAALPARDVKSVQIVCLQQHFELAPRSHLAEEVVQRTNEALNVHEKQADRPRFQPGEMLIEHQGHVLVLPLLNLYWSCQLAQGAPAYEVRRHLEYEQLQVGKSCDEHFTLARLWHWTNQKELVQKSKGKDFLPAETLDVKSLPVQARPLQDITLPDAVLEPIASALNRDYGTKPALAKAMAQKAAQLRYWCCPRIQELGPGQAVWLAYSTRRTKRGQPRLLVPVVLTLLTADEQAKTYADRTDVKALKVRQMERITAEAWQQDGVLTMLDLEWMLNMNGTALRQLLNAYQEQFGVLLPTAGTILDMGRTLTHKTIVVDMALEGKSTQQIAEQIFHTPAAVDQYLKLFDRILILRYYAVPPHLMRQITGHSMALIKEHLAIAERHFPSEYDLLAYLCVRGVELENAQ